MKVIDIDKIKISAQFEEHTPSTEKIIKAHEMFDAGELTKPVVLDERQVLVDGYVRYLVYKARQQKYIPYVIAGENEHKRIVRFAGMIQATKETDKSITDLFTKEKYLLLEDPEVEYKYDVLEYVR